MYHFYTNNTNFERQHYLNRSNIALNWQKACIFKINQIPSMLYNIEQIEVFNIYQNVIQTNNNQNVKFLGKNLSGKCIRKSKKHNLVFKIAILDLINGFLFIVFLNSHFIISTDQI